MTILLVCLIIAVLMPYIAKAPLAIAMNKEGGYDNHLPREQQKNLTGFGARANAAHYNCYEALSYFTPAVLVVMVTQSVGNTHVALAITFIVARCVYLFCYWYDFHVLRSTSWLVGIGASVALLITAVP